MWSLKTIPITRKKKKNTTEDSWKNEQGFQRKKKRREREGGRTEGRKAVRKREKEERKGESEKERGREAGGEGGREKIYNMTLGHSVVLGNNEVF